MLGFILPAVCLHCNAHIDTRANRLGVQRYLCADCMLSMRILLPAAGDDIDDRSFRFSTLRAHTTLHAGFAYTRGNVIQSVVHHSKYASMMRLASHLGAALVEQIPDAFASAELIVPIPLHRTRLAQRGYNQAERIAHGIAASTGIPVAPASLLRRIKQTETQTNKDRTEREENVKGAFRIRADAADWLRGRSVLLIDDVMTTGATLASAAAELDSAGPKAIDVVAFSYAQDV